MSGAMRTGGDRGFQDRLKRIEKARAPRPISEMVERNFRKLRGARDVSPLPDWKDNLRHPAAILAATLGGMLAVLAARCVRFHLTGTGLTGADADITMLMDAAIAAGASFVLFTMLRFRAKQLWLAQAIGVAFMVSAMHNAVHAAPSVFDALFSPDWTAEVVETTEPGSILFRGVSFVVFEDEDAKRKMPSILRL